MLWNFFKIVNQQIFIILSQATTITLYGHIKTTDQRAILQQYGDWYTGRWWVGYFDTARRGLGGLWPRPVPSSLYQM